MKTIQGFQIYGMPEPLTIFEHACGLLQFKYSIPIPQIQQQIILKYLYDEGFINIPTGGGKDDYQLHPDLPTN